MQKKSLTLTEINIVRQKSPLVIKKDSLEFTASYFKPKENDLIEDLLKKIPGIEIESDGTIRVNGTVVKSIMINGRPVFDGEEVKIISQNLLADMIEKVQLINQKKESQNTGIKQEQNEKSINLVLKENKKNILTGQITAAYGSEDRFGAKVNLNKFTPKEQIIFLGTGDNTNGLLDGNTAQNTGIIRRWNTGFNYSNNKNNKIGFNTNYIMDNSLKNDNLNAVRQTFLNDSTYFYNQKNEITINSMGNRIHSQLEYKIDSLQKITFLSQLGYYSSHTQLNNSYKSQTDQSQILNQGMIENKKKYERNSLSFNIIYDKKFKKFGRTLSAAIGYGKSAVYETEFNISYNHFPQTNGEFTIDTINLNNLKSGKSRQLFMTITYLEPISKTDFLQFTFAEDHNDQRNTKFSHSYNNETKLYDILNDSLSNNLKYYGFQRLAKMGWTKQKGKIEISFSLAAFTSKNNNLDYKSNNNTRIDASGILPNLIFNYTFSNGKDISFLYMRNIRLPEISELQPIIDNSNPLFMSIGNPDLKPSSSETFNFSYKSLNATNLRFLSVSANGSFTTDQIVTGTWLDSLGRQISKPLNISGAYNFGIDIENSIPLKSSFGIVRLNTNATYSKELNSSNGTKGSYKNLIINQSFGYSYTYEKTLDCYFSGNINYSNVRYSSEDLEDNSILKYTFRLENSLNLHHGISFTATASYNWVDGNMLGYNPKSLIINASVSKSLFSHKQGLIKLQVFDLLNKSIRINRNIGVNYIENMQTNILQRFFILRFSYFLGRKSSQQ